MVARSSGNDDPSPGRVCSECGQAIGGGIDFVGVHGDHNASRTETTVVRSPTWRRWLLLAGVILVGMIGWSMFSSSAPPDNDDESVAIAEDTSAEATTTETTTTARSSTSKRGTTTTGEIELLGDGGPLLGEEVGYELIIGVSGAGLSVLDLDSGQRRHSGGTNNLDPLAVSGQWLLVRRSDRIAALPLGDLGAEPTDFSFPGHFDLADRQKRADGRVWFWLFDDGPGVPALALLDIASGEVVERLTAPEGVFPSFFSGLSGGATPMLVTGVSGGVYESAGGGFNQVADGRLLAADETRVLVETCDARLHCVKQWLDRRTWEPFVLALPEGQLDTGRFVNGTDWLMHFSWSSGRGPALLNIVTGQEVELGDDSDHYWETEPAISPDGRWLATVAGIGTASTIQIEELATGAVLQIEGVSRPSGSLLFIDRRSD